MTAVTTETALAAGSGNSRLGSIPSGHDGGHGHTGGEPETRPHEVEARNPEDEAQNRELEMMR